MRKEGTLAEARGRPAPRRAAAGTDTIGKGAVNGYTSSSEGQFSELSGGSRRQARVVGVGQTPAPGRRIIIAEDCAGCVMSRGSLAARARVVKPPRTPDGARPHFDGGAPEIASFS